MNRSQTFGDGQMKISSDIARAFNKAVSNPENTSIYGKVDWDLVEQEMVLCFELLYTDDPDNKYDYLMRAGSTYDYLIASYESTVPSRIVDMARWATPGSLAQLL